MSGWEAFFFSLFILAVLLHTFFCVGLILRRIGFSPAWVLLIGLWPFLIPLLAYSRWPVEERTKISN
jgi:hypothetical protein